MAGASLLVAFTGVTASAAPVDEMKDAVYQRARTSGISITTPFESEATSAASQYGYSVDLGTPFKASIRPATGLTAVHRLWNASKVDFKETLVGSDAYKQALGNGYVDNGVRYYALASAVNGQTEPVSTYVKGNLHRLATAATSRSLVEQGWKLEGVAFHVPSANPVTPDPDPTPTPTPPAAGIGSLPVGKASYAVPANAIFVSTSGSDSANGTQATPLRTINRAVAVAPTGGTVVVRGGTYRETVTFSKKVTVQNYPGEAVWMDGSTPVTGWVADGNAWRKDGWTTRFDSSPTYTQGVLDNTAEYWRFINANYPMAAHPDQVFVNGVGLQQVKTRAQVTAGTFYLDEDTSKLYIGSNPSGKTVEASTIIKAMNVRGENATVRGIGVRRFSPSVWHMASITVERPGVTFENVHIEDASTTGISVLRENVTLRNITVQRSGMLGIQARFADGIMFDSVLSTQNNKERFNIAPVSGGAKLGQTRGITVRNSSFVGNYGHGFWEDMSCYNTVISQSSFSDNVGTGLFLEISAKAIVGDSTMSGNGEFGIKVNNTANVKIWNNTFVGNGRPLNIVQDKRRNTNKSDPAVDPRVSFPDPEMPWVLGPVVIRNNVVAAATSSANCLLCVEDYSKTMSAEQMKISSNSNVYQRANATSPSWIAVWSKGPGNPGVYTTLAKFTEVTGQEKLGREFVGSVIVDSNGKLVSSVAALANAIAQPLPADVAKAIGRPAGSKVLGRWS